MVIYILLIFITTSGDLTLPDMNIYKHPEEKYRNLKKIWWHQGGKCVTVKNGNTIVFNLKMEECI